MFGHDFEHMITKDPLAFTKYHNTGAARTLLANRGMHIVSSHLSPKPSLFLLQTRNPRALLAGSLGMFFVNVG
jgi:hypothetical protein